MQHPFPCFYSTLRCVVVRACVRACTFIDGTWKEHCVRSAWLFVCLGLLISLKWPPSIFIRQRRVTEKRGGVCKGKKQWLALIDRGSNERGAEMRERMGHELNSKESGVTLSCCRQKARLPCGPKVSRLPWLDMFDFCIGVKALAPLHFNAFSPLQPVMGPLFFHGSLSPCNFLLPFPAHYLSFCPFLLFPSMLNGSRSIQLP